MELSLLKNIIVKLKVEDFYNALERWSFLKKKEIGDLRQSLAVKAKQTKRVVAVEVAEVCSAKGDLTMDIVGELELICLQMFPAKRQWSAYHLSEKQGTSSVGEISKSPSMVKTQLMKQIRNYFHKSTIIIFSGMKAAYVELVSQCFVEALGYKELTELSLTGHHYSSLAELAMNKFCEGGYTRYQLTHRHRGPLNDITSRKRKAPVVFDSENISDTNKEEKQRRLEILDEHFSDNIQPTLERVEYRVELPYRNKEIEPELKNDGNLFSSRVRFRGTSVLEGLRNLAAASYATVPLPKHLTCIPARARNTFLLAKSQKNVNTSQTVTQNQSRHGK